MGGEVGKRQWPMLLRQERKEQRMGRVTGHEKRLRG